MSKIYRLKARELNHHFSGQIQAKFADIEVPIIVTKFNKAEFLLKSETTKTDC